MHPNYRGPYNLARFPNAEPPTFGIMRQTDGALVIMGQDAEGSPAAVLNIPMRARPKRGEAWRTADPDQEAFAAALVDLLNHAHDNG